MKDKVEIIMLILVIMGMVVYVIYGFTCVSGWKVVDVVHQTTTGNYITKEKVCEELGFDRIIPNSVDYSFNITIIDKNNDLKVGNETC